MSIEACLERIDVEVRLQRERVATAPDETLDAEIARFHALTASRDRLRSFWRLLGRRKELIEAWKDMKRTVRECVQRISEILDAVFDPARPSRQTAFAPFLWPAERVGIRPRTGHESRHNARRDS